MNNISQPATLKFHPTLQDYCQTLAAEFDQIDAERKIALEEIAAYIIEKRQAGEPVKITVICTHNSRRSHMGQLWLEAAAAWYGVAEVHGFSGGTEATAFNHRAVATMQHAGFQIETPDKNNNPRYHVTLSADDSPRILFSKRYDDAVNPAQGFAAVMVCTDADEACPIVPGAEKRFAIPYDDPKHFDDTPQESTKYDERCRQIAREFFYMMHVAKEKL
ncbi:MAG TPA: protein-tyrosine-phosphatase [Saprospiraceae bacterium]|nr:protein-tyrosine-phosphatase [Saprospiraceae bacterium]HMP23046.1 protein-tyrosine-phosphatase [Saprospiraceae bacterium]